MATNPGYEKHDLTSDKMNVYLIYSLLDSDFFSNIYLSTKIFNQVWGGTKHKIIYVLEIFLQNVFCG